MRLDTTANQANVQRSMPSNEQPARAEQREAGVLWQYSEPLCKINLAAKGSCRFGLRCHFSHGRERRWQDMNAKNSKELEDAYQAYSSTNPSDEYPGMQGAGRRRRRRSNIPYAAFGTLVYAEYKITLVPHGADSSIGAGMHKYVFAFAVFFAYVCRGTVHAHSFMLC